MRDLILRTKTFIEKHERVLSAGALLFGFIVDSLTLRRIDFWPENVALISYLTLAAFSIVILAHRHRGSANKILTWAITVAPLTLQIAFGTLFSAFVVFYFRSASLSASWPFLAFLLCMLIGNEAFRERYKRITFHVSVFFVALLSYAIMIVPVLTRSIGALEFLLGVGVSIALASGFVWVLRKIAQTDTDSALPYIIRSIGIISAVCLLAYITNSIPPAPLSLSGSAVAHNVLKTNGGYVLLVEPRSTFDVLRMKEVYHRTAGEPVYVWTSVFAPTKLSTPIVHEWQYRDGWRWKTAGRISFPITGGRDEGYRGFSTKENLTTGAWRVSVETQEGLVIGRVRFDVVSSEEAVHRQEVVR